MYCPNCGKIYESKLMLRICEYCGENLAERDCEKKEKIKMALGDPMNLEYFISGPEVQDVRFNKMNFGLTDAQIRQMEKYVTNQYLTINEARDYMELKPFVDANLGQTIVNPEPNMALFVKSPPENFQIIAPNPFGEPKRKLTYM